MANVTTKELGDLGDYWDDYVAHVIQESVGNWRSQSTQCMARQIGFTAAMCGDFERWVDAFKDDPVIHSALISYLGLFSQGSEDE